MDANVDRGELGRRAGAPRTAGTPAKRQDMREREQGLLSVCACVSAHLLRPRACISDGLTFISFIPLPLKINKRSSRPRDRRSAPRVSAS